MTIVLTGANTLLLSKELQKLTTDFIAEHGDLAFERLDGEEVSADKVFEAVQSMPFLASKKMVVVRAAGSNKDLAEQIETLIDAPGETTELILYEPKIDKRSVYYKTLKKKADLREFTELDERGLAQWLIDTAKQEEGTLSYSDASYLIQRVGQNQLLLGNELEKLLLYDKKITKQTIDLLTEQAPQSKIFDLIDAAFAGNAKKALALYEDQRAQNVEPQQIMAMLSWQLHVLALISTAGQKPADDIAREAKLSPFVVRKSVNLARSTTANAIKTRVYDLLQIDIRSKSEALDLDDALRYFILSMA